MWQAVADGGFADFADLAIHESEIDEGKNVRLSLTCRSPISASISQQLQEQLLNRGIPDARVQTSGNLLHVFFRKGFPWLAVIAAIILAMIVLAILIVSWQLFKEVADVLGPAAPAVATFGVLVILGVIVLAAIVVYKMAVKK